MKGKDDETCEYGAKETVVHVLVNCPLLRTARETLHMKIRKLFNTISFILGGKTGSRRLKDKKWKISKELNPVLDRISHRVDLPRTEAHIPQSDKNTCPIKNPNHCSSLIMHNLEILFIFANMMPL
jgi:hypothetical protein